MTSPLLPRDPTNLGGYTLTGRLGSGGFGVIFQATAPSGDQVAIKLLNSELSTDPTFRSRLAQEGQAMEAVRSDRTARIIEVVTDGPDAYLVMELIDGKTLDEHMHINGPFKGPELWFVAEGLIEGITAIHQAGIIHRDLKPANIMYGADGIKILDFGISAIVDDNPQTRTGAFMASAAWISPEQIRGDRATTASDIFMIGLILAYAATGEHPYGTGRSDAVMFRIAHQDPNIDSVPHPLEEAVRACLSKDPDSRPRVDALTNYFQSGGSTSLNIGVASGPHGTMVIGATPTPATTPEPTSEPDDEPEVKERPEPEAQREVAEQDPTPNEPLDTELPDTPPPASGPHGTVVIGATPTSTPAYTEPEQEAEFKPETATEPAQPAIEPAGAGLTPDEPNDMELADNTSRSSDSYGISATPATTAPNDLRPESGEYEQTADQALNVDLPAAEPQQSEFASASDTPDLPPEEPRHSTNDSEDSTVVSASVPSEIGSDTHNRQARQSASTENERVNTERTARADQPRAKQRATAPAALITSVLGIIALLVIVTLVFASRDTDETSTVPPATSGRSAETATTATPEIPTSTELVLTTTAPPTTTQPSTTVAPSSTAAPTTVVASQLAAEVPTGFLNTTWNSGADVVSYAISLNQPPNDAGVELSTITYTCYLSSFDGAIEGDTATIEIAGMRVTQEEIELRCTPPEPSVDAPRPDRGWHGLMTATVTNSEGGSICIDTRKPFLGLPGSCQNPMQETWNPPTDEVTATTQPAPVTTSPPRVATTTTILPEGPEFSLLYHTMEPTPPGGTIYFNTTASSPIGIARIWPEGNGFDCDGDNGVYFPQGTEVTVQFTCVLPTSLTGGNSYTITLFAANMDGYRTAIEATIEVSEPAVAPTPTATEITVDYERPQAGDTNFQITVAGSDPDGVESLSVELRNEGLPGPLACIPETQPNGTSFETVVFNCDISGARPEVSTQLIIVMSDNIGNNTVRDEPVTFVP